jgi:EmrB/QacA subfamily drug resistance transporter
MTTSQLPLQAGEPASVAPWRALPVLVAGVFLVVLDFFIVNVAMPSMQKGLHATPDQLEWVVAGYGLTLAVFLLTAGRLGDQIGRRRMYCIGVAVFTVTSLACAVAGSPETLVAARLVQGIGAALIMPSMLSLIGVLFSGPDLAKAISVYGMVMGLAAAGGQIIGGALIQADLGGLGWRLIFAINIPVGILVLLLAPRLVPESRAGSAAKLDVPGLVLMTLTVTCVVLPLIEGRQAGWPVWTWELLALSGVLLATTVAQQRRLAARGGAPLFPPALVKVPAFRAGLAVQLVYWCGQASFYLFLALYLQTGRGMSALGSGTFFAVLAVAYLATSMRAPGLVARRGRSVVIAGALTITAGYAALLAALAEGPDRSVLLLAPGLLLIGAGQGLCITPLTSIVLSQAGPTQAGSVSGALSTSQQIGNALGVAAIGVVFFADHSGTASAFGWSLLPLAGVSVAVSVMARALPRGVRGEVAA